MPSRERIFSCHPDRGADAELCAEEIVTRLGSRAFRRPIAENDLGRLMQYLPRRRGARRIRRRYPQRDHGHSREPVLPLSRRARADDIGGRHEIPHRRSRARIQALVLPLEHDARRRAARDRSPRRAERAGVFQQQVGRMLADPRRQRSPRNFVYQWLDMLGSTRWARTAPCSRTRRCRRPAHATT